MNPFSKYLLFTDIILKGISQIMLQENRWTGLFLLAGIFTGNRLCGIAAIVAAITSTVTVRLLKFNKESIQSGLYGFNAVLTGIVLAFFFQNTWLLWVLVITGSACASLLQHIFLVKRFPAYTFPFILLSWIMIYFIQRFTLIPSTDMITLVTSGDSFFNYLLRGFRGFAQVIFQHNLWSGVIFFIAVFLSSPVAAFYGLAASLAGASLAQWAGQSIDVIHSGLFGFNAVLSAIVFSRDKKKDAFWVVISVILTVIIHITLVTTGILDTCGGVLTFPFVAGTWLTLLIQKAIKKPQ